MRILAALVANGVGQAAAAGGTAFAVQAAFDRLVAGASGRSMGTVAMLGAGLAAAAAATAYLRSRERFDAERLGQSYVHAVRMAMYEHLSAIAPRELEGRSRGGVMLRFVGDLTALRQWVSLGLSRVLVSGTFAAGALAALAFISPALALAAGTVLLVGVSGAVGLAGPMRRRSREARRRRTRLAANVNEKVATIGVVQVFGQTERERERLEGQSDRLAESMIARARVIGRMRGATEGTAALASLAVLMVGAAEVAAERSTAGSVVAAMAVVAVLGSSLRDLGRVQEYWHTSRVSLEKLRDFLSTPAFLSEAPGAPSLPSGPGRLELEDIHLGNGLCGVSVTAEEGKVIALVGPNGAGKSSLLAVAARLVEPDRGTVRLDGRDLAQHSLSSVRQAISMAGPDLPLLRGSVEKNLRYRQPEASPDELERVISLCGVQELIGRLPRGLKTRVVEGGHNLSAGERQRLALARALLGGPRVLLLDEADANLDASARAVVERVVRSERSRRTIVLVSHRSEILEWADDVWRLEDGRLAVEEGITAGGDAAHGVRQRRSGRPEEARPN